MGPIYQCIRDKSSLNPLSLYISPRNLQVRLKLSQTWCYPFDFDNIFWGFILFAKNLSYEISEYMTLSLKIFLLDSGFVEIYVTSIFVKEYLWEYYFISAVCPPLRLAWPLTIIMWRHTVMGWDNDENANHLRLVIGWSTWHHKNTSA